MNGSEPMRRVMEIPGFGPIVASSFVAALGDGQAFKCGRVVSAWLGLVPRQHSTGGKPILLGISKRGNRYLRTMLVHGARAVLRTAEAKDRSFQPSETPGPFQRWRGSAGWFGQRRTNSLVVFTVDRFINKSEHMMPCEKVTEDTSVNRPTRVNRKPAEGLHR